MRMNALLIGFYFLFLGCGSKDNTPTPQPPGSKIYEACCGIEPTEFEVGNGRIFIPNVFTPNGDGMNDLFFPSFSPEIVEISGFFIAETENDPFYQCNLPTDLSNVKNLGWDGLRSDGKEYEGLFYWEMYVLAKNGVGQLLKGKGCRIVCGPNAVVFLDKDGCYYSEQAIDGVLDKAISVKEKDCFK